MTMTMTKDDKALRFHQNMVNKAEIEIEFWQKEVNFHKNKMMIIKNKSEEFVS